MQDAYDRARETGGSDVFGVLAGLEEDQPDVISGGSAGDDVETQPDRPQLGPVDPPPSTPDPEAPWQEYSPSSPVQTSAPSAPDQRSQRLAAAREAQRMIAEPAGPTDTDIAAAQGRDREKRGRDAFTEAIQAWLTRRPQRFTAPSESEDLVQRRQLADRQKTQGLTAQQLLVRSLTDAKGGKGPPELTPYQVEQLKRRDSDDKYRRDKDTRKAETDASALAAGRKSWAPVLKEMGIDPEVATQKDIDRAMQRDSSLATRELARSQFGYKQTRDVQDDQKDLSKALGAEPEHLTGLIGRLKTATTSEDIPGVGPMDRLVPDIVSGDAALQNRNDMREAVRIMLVMKSGKTVTPQEAADYARIYGIDGSEEAFRQGVTRLETDIADTIKAKKSGFSPAAREAYEGAGGAKTPPKPDAPASGPPPGLIPPGAKNVKKLKNGRWFYELNGEAETVGEETR